MTTNNNVLDNLIGYGVIMVWLVGSYLVYVVIKREDETILKSRDHKSEILALLGLSWVTLLFFAGVHLLSPKPHNKVTVKHTTN